MSTLRTNYLESTDGTVTRDVKLLVEEGSGFTVFDNISDMEASPDLKVGDKVKTLGYSLPQDGGGNYYEVVTSGTYTADGGSVIDLSGAGAQALASFSSIVSVKQFGILESVSNNATQLQRAIDFADALYVPEGEYVVGNQILLKSNFKLYGEGTIKSSPSPSFVSGTNSSHYAAIYGRELENVTVTGITLDTLDVTAVPNNAFSLRGILFNRCTNVDILDCKFNVNGGATAILGCDTYRIKNNNILVQNMTGETDGVIDDWSEGNPLFSATVSNNYIQGSDVSRWGILFNGVEYLEEDWYMESIVVSENVVDDCTLDGIWLGGREPKIDSFSVTNNKIARCRKGVSLSGCSSGVVEGNIIRDCHSRGIHLWKEEAHPESSGCIYTTVSGNIIQKNYGTVEGVAIDLSGDTNLNALQENLIGGSSYEYGYLLGSETTKNIISPKIIQGVSRGTTVDNGTGNIVTSGKYTPDVSTLNNFDSVSYLSASYHVEGTVVTVHFAVSASAGVADEFSRFSVSLPTSYKVGTITGASSTDRFAAAIQDYGSTANVTCYPTSTDKITYSGFFSYQIDI